MLKNGTKKAGDTADIKKSGAIAFASDGEDGREDWNGYSQRYFGIHLSAGSSIQVLGDIVDEIDEVADKDFQTLSDKADDDAQLLNVNDIGEAIDIINEIKDLDDTDKALIVMANSGVAVRIGHFGVGAYVLGEIATNIQIDLQNVGFFGTGVGDAIDNISSDLGTNTAIDDRAAGLSADQMNQLHNDIQNMPGWNSNLAWQYVNAAEQGISNDGQTATAEDVETIRQIAEIASNIESGTGGGNFSDNQTSITFIGPVILEVPLTYGYAINDYWSVGGNVKYMRGKIFFTRFTVFETDSDDILADAQRESEESDYFGVDLGTLLRCSDFRIGFVGRNLNEPRFDYITDDEEKKTWRLNPQARAGIAYMPCDWFTITADADITRNKTAKEDYFSQLVAGGVEFNVFNFLALRGGAYTNVGDSTEHDEFVYTAGLGLNFWGVHLDAGAAMSEKRSEFNGQSIPDEIRGELALSAQF